MSRRHHGSGADPAAAVPRQMTLAVLGDSVAAGAGASSAQDAIGARLASTLRLAGIALRLRVLAVPGARSATLAV